MSTADLDFLAAGGESGALIRSIDWSKTPLGPPRMWPRSLQMVVQIMLASQFAMRILWGKELIFLYNDAYRPVLGINKHPGAMGRPTEESYTEIWDIVGPLFHRVLDGEAIGLDDYPLTLDRNGYLEECYFTLSYSPVHGDDNTVRGVLGVVHEVTDRVLGARRLRALRELAASAARARTPEIACITAAEAFATDAADVPFALVYLTELDGRTAKLVATSAYAAVPSPATIALDGRDSTAWPLHLAIATRDLQVIDDLERFGPLHAGPYPEPITKVVILPLTRPNLAVPHGFVVAGVNPRHALDDAYRGFFDLAMEHVVTALTNALADVNERRLAEEQRAKLFELFMQAPAGICVSSGPNHVFELSNPPYREIIGGRDVIGKTLAEGLPEVSDTVLPLLDEVYRTGEPFYGNEVRVPVLRDGVVTERDFNFIYQPLRDHLSGQIEGIFTLVVEVTQQVAARTRAEQLTSSLEITNRDLDQFAYVASHDLKAPLRGIANLSEWIEEAVRDIITDETKTHLSLLRGRVHRLEALIDGILSYSRAARERKTVEPVDLGALARDVRDLLAPGPDVTIVIGELPTINGERVPLQQVLMNLVSNAMKHGKLEAKPLRIELSSKDMGTWTELIVADDGRGIAPKYHDRIWGIFQTLEARDKVEGTGIGLSVVKKIVETRDGRVWIESEEGKGAAFHVALPLLR